MPKKLDQRSFVPMLRAPALASLLAVASLALAADPAETLTVEQAVERGRKAQPALRFAVDSVEAAHQRVGEAIGGYLPQISANFQYQLSTSNYVLSPGLSHLVGTSGGPVSACLSGTGTVIPCPAKTAGGESMTPYNYFNPALNVTETIWDFGRTSNAVGQANAAERGSQDDLATARHQVDLNVRTAFYTALADQQLVDVAKEQVEDQAKHLALAQARFDVGAGNKSDVSLALANEKNAEVALFTAQNNFDVAKATLNQAMGAPTTSIDYRLVPTPLELEATIPNVEAGTEQALQNRPDYKSAVEKVVAQQRLVDAERANLYPSLAASGQLGWASYGTLPLIYNWQVGATLTVPIYTGGIDYHKIKEYEATLDSLIANRDTLGLQVRLDVQSAVVTALQTKASLASAEAAVKSGEDALALAEGQYQVGVGTIVTVDDAQVTEVTAKAGLIQADYNFEAALAKLRYALGQD
ncbi:MAG TPA: TolC family protein [Myxococcales bacterium]|nr:TolC family protein [Myxococcales bacterium]